MLQTMAALPITPCDNLSISIYYPWSPQTYIQLNFMIKRLIEIETEPDNHHDLHL